MTRDRPPHPGAHEGACPEASMLSAYLDDTLDPGERARIEDHISRCEDCYFVVRESAHALALDAAAPHPAQPLPFSQSPPRPASRRRALFGGGLLPLAAAIVVGVGAVALWRQMAPAPPYPDAIRPLVEAVGERRFFEPRLTGGFKFGPTVAARRSPGSGPPSEAWAMLAAAGEIRDRMAATSASLRGSRAAAALFLGESEQAISEYSRLVLDEPTNAEWSSNLSAALLVRASTAPGNASRDRADALSYAERALRLDPRLGEASFNRSLALKALGRIDEARRGFEAIAKENDSWSAAARDELRDLGEPTGPRS